MIEAGNTPSLADFGSEPNFDAVWLSVELRNALPINRLEIVNVLGQPVWNQPLVSIKTLQNLAEQSKVKWLLSLPGNTPNYTHDPLIVNGLVRKSEIPSVIMSAREVSNIIRNHLMNAKKQEGYIFDLGIGIGLDGLMILEGLPQDFKYIGTMGGFTDLAGIYHFAKAGNSVNMIIPNRKRNDPPTLGRVNVIPYIFGQDLPYSLMSIWGDNKVDVFFAGHSLVYLNKEEFKFQVYRYLNFLAPGGMLFITGLNRGPRVPGLLAQEKKNGYAYVGQLLKHLMIRKAGRAISMFKAASKIYEPLLNMQLPPDVIRGIMKETAAEENCFYREVDIQGGLNKGYVIVKNL